MEVKNPRRILAVGAPDSGVLELLKELTGTAPEPRSVGPTTVDEVADTTTSPTTEDKVVPNENNTTSTTSTTAGLSHTLELKTPYYAATLPVWIDEISSLPQWRDDFLSPEASEVVSSLGAWLYCFRKPQRAADREVIRETMSAIQNVIEKGVRGGAMMWDGVCVAVAMGNSIKVEGGLEWKGEEWEEWAMEKGWEVVDGEVRGKGKNEFGEKVGLERVREALEANEWEGGGAGGDSDEEDGREGLGMEEAEMNMEFWGLKDAINRGGEGGDEEDEDLKVQELETMMRRLQAVRDASADLPESERRKLAAQAVNDIMKSF